MSKKIKERTRELAQRENAIKEKLLGKSGGVKSKINKAGKTALVGGIIAILLYGIYKAFIQGDSKPKKGKAVNTSASIVTEKLMTFFLPYLGRFLDDFLNRKKEKKEKVEQVED